MECISFAFSVVAFYSYDVCVIVVYVYMTRCACQSHQAHDDMFGQELLFVINRCLFFSQKQMECATQLMLKECRSAVARM